MNAHAKQMWAGGGTIFAATAMLIVGVFQLIVGIAAIGRDVVFVTNTNYVYYLNFTAWGWIHMILGALLILCAIGLYARARWAMGVGIVLAALAAIDNFFFLPFYPLWSFLIIALSIFVIWSLGTTLSAPAAGGVEGRGAEAVGPGEREGRRDWAARDADTREAATREREAATRETGARETTGRDMGATGREAGTSGTTGRDTGSLDPGRHRTSSS